ncbi:DUF2190 family protein [Alteriqipengyuania flavescens]|uniref:DUF2190 family protein n=1 Tax=Alteriqipengyuania flavescens TaxID=3053610 RepID=UPI0025B49476|nr:DUF2190 family protein [Alteriqipengyuania flavescens]WJY18684.1 DUF2190 family protein [Alteriqipengyuania flavescens]WJY24624.1 DUF2190 family protein [Alteriqipengyuania flavescens]
MRFPRTPLLSLTLTASAAVIAHRFVAIGGSHAGAAADALGVADYAAEPDEAFAVTVHGTQTVEAGGAFNAGDKLEVGADGKAVALAAGEPVAKAMEDSAGDGSLVTVLLTP